MSSNAQGGERHVEALAPADRRSCRSIKPDNGVSRGLCSRGNDCIWGLRQMLRADPLQAHLLPAEEAR
jgi:hypothetical protein